MLMAENPMEPHPVRSSSSRRPFTLQRGVGSHFPRPLNLPGGPKMMMIAVMSRGNKLPLGGNVSNASRSPTRPLPC